MTFPPPIPRPERAEGTVLAALLAVLLALMVLAQFMLPRVRPELSEVPPAAVSAVQVPIVAVQADPVLARRPIFRPIRLASGGTASVPAGPLDGAVPAGIVRVRGMARLVLQTPDGRSVTLRPGQSWQGWRLVSIGRNDVRFSRGGETVRFGLGAAERYSYPGFPPAYDPRGSAGAYRPNQAEEQ